MISRKLKETLKTLLLALLVISAIIWSVFMFKWYFNRNKNAKQYIETLKRAEEMGYTYKDGNKIYFKNRENNKLIATVIKKDRITDRLESIV